MIYSDGTGTTRRLTRPVRRRPLNNPPAVDAAARESILAAAARLPKFTAAELAAELSQDGPVVDTVTVRAVLEQMH